MAQQRPAVEYTAVIEYNTVLLIKDHVQETMKLHIWNGIKYRNYLQFEPIKKYFRLVHEISGFLLHRGYTENSFNAVATKSRGTLGSGVCKIKYCFALFFTRNSSDLVTVNSKDLH